MSPLKTAVAASAAFILGWAAHEALARAADHPEPTARSPYQDAQALRSQARRKRAEKGGELITPLNTRDPSALVMGPAAQGPGDCVERPAPKCDCAAEKLKKTGRAVPERF